MDFQARANEIISKYGTKPLTVVVIDTPLGSNAGFSGKSRGNLLGQASLRTRELRVRRASRLPEEVIETLHHELAHFIAFDLHRCTTHGPVWKRYAKQLDAIPRAHVGSYAYEKERAETKKSAKAARAKARRESRKLAA